jgi:hypothetical protein
VTVIFKSIWINYGFAIFLWFVLFSFLSLLLAMARLEQEMIRQATAAIAAAMVAFGSYETVGLQKRAKVLFAKHETDTWAEPGFYFLFWAFGFYEEEIQETQRFDVKVGVDGNFTISDKNGKKLRVKIDADYAIGNTNEDRENYKKIQEADFPGNLKTLLERAANRVFGGMEYWSELLGKELHSLILNDLEVKTHSKKYGIIFTSIMVEVVSGNQDQDDLNAQRRSLTVEYQKLYPTMSDQKISETVEVQLKLVDKFISEVPVGARYEIGESGRGQRGKPPK